MLIIKKIILLLFFFSLQGVCHSQSYNIPDSLLKKVNSPALITKTQAYVEIINYYNKVMPFKALSYGESALQIAKENKYKKGESDILYALGSTHQNTGEFKKSLHSYELSYTIRKELDDTGGMGESLNGIALVHMVLGAYDRSLEYLYQAIYLLEKGPNHKALGEAYNLLGIINYILKDVKKAEEISLKALKITENLPQQLVHAFSHENLGIIYIKTKQNEKALYHTNETLKIRQEMNDRVGESGSYENLGIIYKNMKKYSTALYYYNKSLSLKKELNDKQGIGSSYFGIGNTYIKMGEPEKGLEFLLKSYNMKKETGEKRGMVSSLNKIADTYTDLGDHKNALVYYKLSVAYNDSLLNEQKNKAIAEMQEQFQSERQEQEILLLQRENTIQKNLRNYLLIISLLISVIAVSSLIAYRSKQKVNSILNLHNMEVTKQKEELQRLNDELKKLNADKDRFFTIIAHDLKSPFTSLLGYSEFLARDIKNLSDEEIGTFSEEIFNSARKVFNLLENLLWWARLNTGKIEKNPTIFQLSEVVEEVLALYKANAEKKHIFFECELETDTQVYADINMMHSVLRNLISNAIKFTSPCGRVKIVSKKDEDLLQFRIEDNGIGMDEEHLRNLFIESNIKSRKGTVKEAGTGLGLYLCKEFVEMNNGSIWASSVLESGTTIYFTLPVKNILI